MRFAGYAAVFDRVDRAGDVMRAGAFGEIGAVPLLWQHRGAPVGVIETIGEDATGLRVVGRIEDRFVAGLVGEGALRGLSVGYRATRVGGGARRVIEGAALIEVSLVAQPMQPLARVLAVAGADGSWQTEAA